MIFDAYQQSKMLANNGIVVADYYGTMTSGRLLYVSKQSRLTDMLYEAERGTVKSDKIYISV